MVFVLAMVCGRIGGPCRKDSRDGLLHSRSLEEALRPWTDALPGETTIPENSNALTERTIETIHWLQLREAREENLDSFKRVAVDSTAVGAASCWPTDSKTVRELCRRSLSTQSRLESLGWKSPSPHKWQEWLEGVDRRHKAISMSGRGEYAAAERRSRYRDFFRVAFKLVTRLLQHHQSAQD